MYEGSQIQPTDWRQTRRNNDGKAWCIKCNKRQPYDVHTRITKCDFERKGKRIIFDYLELYATCRVCQDEIYVPDINDANVHARNLAYDNFVKEREQNR